MAGRRARARARTGAGGRASMLSVPTASAPSADSVISSSSRCGGTPQQRFSEKLTLHVSLDVKENWHSIEPMLLIPFIENAFKHGTGLINNPEIEIELKAENDQLYFVVKNRFSQTETTKDKTSGIGLANVKRRLELLYGNCQHLTINKTDGWFIVSLQLTFKS